jgi:DNA-binding NtrC family response regulator
MAKPKILIVDDERPTRDVMARALSDKYDCVTAADAEQAMKAIAENPDLALIISDVRMPGEDGVSLIKRAKAANPSLACMLLTAYGTVDLAVAAMKDGADDFLTKPITDLDQLELRVAKAIKTRSLERQVDDLKSQLSEKLETFTGNSPEMQKVYRLIRQAAPSNANVLIEGPSGTGKELVAHALHSLSPRAEGPFVAVECAALSPTLLESELFGHERGAFTDAVRQKIGRFEAANGGTLFLDEISEIDASTQVKLLRVLESRTFQRVGGTEDIKTDIRIVAATNRDLAKFVAEGKFREDLYYRLNVIDIHLPALKERTGDIALLVSRFLKEFASENGNRVTGIDARAMKALEDYSWPGNVRQLRNIVEKMVVLSGGGKLTIDDVPVEVLGETPGVAVESAPAAATPAAIAEAAPLSLADAEKTKILSVLESVKGNKSKAAELLGISRRTIHRKLNEWKIRT